MSDTAVILFGHGARNPEWSRPINALAKMLEVELAPWPVYVAFLQFGEPKLDEVIEKAINGGASRIVVLPHFLAAGGHILKDLPQTIDSFKSRFPDVEFDVAPPLGETPEVMQGLKQACIGFAKKAF